MDISAYFKEKKEAVDDFLDQALPLESVPPQNLHRAMRYSLFAGGKRIRPILAIAAFEAVSGKSKAVVPVASSLELIHTYSLIHDDLPAMDDDDYRRGKPTNHKVFGEAIAILAGDALLTLAFDLLSQSKITRQTSAKTLIQIVQELAEGAGHFGMIGGQVVDIESEGKKVSQTELEYIHRHKTAALIRASLVSGAMLSGASAPALKAIREAGTHLGLAFQIVDDILDATEGAARLGKTAGKDEAARKATYVSVHGIDRARRMAEGLREDALAAVAPLGERGVLLAGLAHLIVERHS